MRVAIERGLKVHDDKWFFRTEDAWGEPKMTFLESTVGHLMYWFVCWTDERKAAKKWPWNEEPVNQEAEVKPSFKATLAVMSAWAIVVTGYLCAQEKAFTDTLFWKVVLPGIGGFLIAQTILLAANRLAKVQKANQERDAYKRKLQQIKGIVNGDGTGGYRMPGAEPPAFREIRDIIGE